MTEVTTLISNVGFPIACCVYLMYQQQQTNKLFNDITTTLKGIDTRLEQIEKNK